MARMRSIKPEFFADQDLAEELPSRDARLLYIGLWGVADEHGRLRGDARWLKGELFAYDDDLTPDVIDKLIEMIAQSGRAVRYRVGRSAYLFLPKLAEHQRLEPDKVPSRLPSPDEDQAERGERSSSENRADSSERHANSSALKHVAGGMEQGAESRRQAADARGADEPPHDSDDGPGAAERITTKWVSSLRKQPQRRIVNDIGKAVAAAIAEGQDPADVEEALNLWQAKGTLGVNALPGLIHQVATAAPPGTDVALRPSRASPDRRPSHRDQAVNAALAHLNGGNP